MTPHTDIGISAPLYSLRSNGEAGTGDFGDVAALVNLACALGIGKVVLHAVVDTSFDGGGQPIYPVYIDLRQLPQLSVHARLDKYSAEAGALDKQPTIDYQKVYNVKMHMLRERFIWEGAEILGSEAYHAFWRANRTWIERYSVYCALRHNYGTGNSRHVIERDYESMLSDAHFINEYSEDIKFHLYVQFLLHTQLQRAASYASERGISLVVSNETPRNVFFRQWWVSLDAQQRQQIYGGQLGLPGPAPASPEPWVAEAYIRNKLTDRESDVIIPIWDWLATTSLLPRDAAGNSSESQGETWCYRMDVSLGSILSHTALLECLRLMIADSDK